MRIVFQMPYPGYLRIYGSTVQELAARGHDVRLVYDSPKRRDPGAEELERRATIEEPFPALRGHRATFARHVRLGADYARYLDPRFADAQPVRRRLDKHLPRGLAFMARLPVLPSPLARLVTALFRGLEHLVPGDARVRDHLMRLAPDCVVVTPLLGRGESSVRQTETVRAAHRLGIPVGAAVTSWDHLTSKGLLKGRPDGVFVWNDAQKAEAVELHDVDPGRVVVTGAQLFDHWFEQGPQLGRDEFLASVGLPQGRPYVLYVGSSANIAPAEREIEFVRNWIAQLRSSDSAELRRASILVRPHPGNIAAWAQADLSDIDAVEVSPRERPSIPMTDPEVAHYFDSLHHSSAVVGINTSAMIEAAIAGRPVHTITVPEFADTQGGTLHFHLLLPPGGGAVRLAADMGEHTSQVAEAVEQPDVQRERAQAFVRSFVRPHGLDSPATPILADAIERLADLAEGDGPATPAAEFVHPLPRRELYRKVARRYLAVGRYVARGVWAPSKRDEAKVSGIYESHYDIDPAGYAKTRDKRRDVFLAGRRPLHTDGWFTIRFHADAIDRVLREQGGDSVLEVGAGRGTNLALLAMRRPDLRLSGLELTRSGVEQSELLAKDPPAQYLRAAGFRTLDESQRAALGRIDFRQGTALEMPFEDDAFDVSFTCLVLEQLTHDWPAVVREMVRVTRRHCFFLEPFADANNLVGRAYLRSLDYFRAHHEQFEDLGLETIEFSTDIPQKVHFGTGLLVARVASRPARPRPTPASAPR